jgi:hypothetical protein
MANNITIANRMKTDFQQLIKTHFGNTLKFGRVIGVSYPTAWRYVNYPVYMRLIDIQKISDELNIDIKIIVQMAINSSVITIKNEGDE